MRRSLVALLLGMTAACSSHAQTPVPGFDLRAYPGDSAMRAWLHPASPYYWVGYYLPAPCHRDSSFVGKYPTLAKMGWGMAAIYVGQQDFTQMSSSRPNSANNAPGQPIICSATLLTAAQGKAEAADAVAKMVADGFPARSAVFLDVELVTTVSPALLDYVRAWFSGIASDGRYRPGLYTAKGSAPDLFAAVGAATTPVWLSSGVGFSLDSLPRAAGLDYATIWQGAFGVSQTWNGVTMIVDVNVATSKTP